MIKNTPRQTRSAEQLQKLLAAVETVLNDKPFHKVSVADIAEAAGVSPAFLYTRFENKQALLDYVVDEFLADQQQAAALIFDTGKWEVGLADRIQWLAEQFQRSVELNPGKLRALNEMTVSETPDSTWLDETASPYIVKWLLDCRDEITHPDPELAVTVAIQMLTLGIQARPLLNPMHPGASVPAPEVVRMVLGYLKAI